MGFKKTQTQSSHLYALVDCNNFFASCERVFRPDLEGQPIVVLSNNDGCIVARSNEVKALDVPMAGPYFKSRDVLRRHGVHVFSSNYELYADLSARVMSVLADFSPDLEVYSIDEAFLNLDGFDAFDLDVLMQDLRAQVKQWTGLPVSIGVGPTKTLAKLAAGRAKKEPRRNGVFILTDNDVI
ncbi:MAG: Y-family DNA polymerase, partial [Magnetovibrio sp.]|nr:Y-family DNA polymerase [Magnetovibrio sp.]